MSLLPVGKIVRLIISHAPVDEGVIFSDVSKYPRTVLADYFLAATPVDIALFCGQSLKPLFIFRVKLRIGIA
jgi:hypothetical protein